MAQPRAIADTETDLDTDSVAVAVGGKFPPKPELELELDTIAVVDAAGDAPPSTAPRLGSTANAATAAATSTPGTATTANGSLHPNEGPRYPATPCPHIAPRCMHRPTIDDAYDRELGGNRSPAMENTSGSAPPTATPVSVRNTKSSQYCVTNKVMRHGPCPSKIVHTNSLLRWTTSVSAPMIRQAGRPSRKKATEICPPSLLSLSRSLKPKSCAIWEVGEVGGQLK